MNILKLPTSHNCVQQDPVNRISRFRALHLAVRVGAVLILAGLLVSSFCLISSASSENGISKTQNPAFALAALRPVDSPSRFAELGAVPLSPLLKAGSYALPLPVPQSSPLTVATYAGDCSTPKTVFNLQDADTIVCAKITGAQPSWRVIWSNSNSLAVQNQPVGSGTSTFTLSSTSSLGDWRVILFEPFGGSVQKIATFTVIDAANPSADVSISKGAISGSTSSGAQVLFLLRVANSGPSAATAVQLSDSVPGSTTFVSFDQLDGPIFECTNPMNDSSTGSSVCTIAALERGESATFVATYNVGAASAGTVISNIASVSTSTSDPNSDNNSSVAEVPVIATACQLSTPENITVSADSGQAGAVVTYATPTGTGDCGQATTGEGGETISPISCNPASGSFFPVGTSTVICSAQTGSAVSFQVTVDNPGALSISLNGANPLTVECGTDFNDPGASAVNGTGQSVPVTTTYPSGFNPDAPAVGSYIITYTATEDPNSTSTTRTVNVSDSEAPSITIDGANPYRIQQGSCSPFTDPGASANDGCAGAKPVSSSIAGPGGATSVNPNVPGTYTVTYTATDGTHQATATRTVLVGMFSEDEVDQPASTNVPPTITLTCPSGVTDCSQTSIECGDTFTDLGATASACGSSVPVTTSGTVDRHTPGIYSITYSATANGLTSTATRTVTVGPDNTAPTITVTGANPMTVECHTSFTDPGAVAHDACAGDFAATASGSVNANVVGSYLITYNATDPSGHVATPVTRTVNVEDHTAPTITTCPAAQSANANSSCQAAVPNFTAGAAASDSCGGAITITQSPVAGTIVGIGPTTVTITATDVWNNSSTCQTTFTVNAPQLSGNGTANIWVGLKNSDDVGTKFDLRAEILRNGFVVGTGEVYGISGGSSGFNNAIQDAISQIPSGPASFCPGNVLGLRLSVRVATNSGHVSGTARLWYNDSAANSRFTAIVNNVTNTYYLRDGSVLAATAGPGPKKTIDVLVNRNQNGNPFKPFGTWNVTF
jgi:uncharacterized repeat protein (TIGR01451 family)